MSVDEAGAPDARVGVEGHPPSPWPIDDARRRRLRPWAIVGAVLVALVTGTITLSYTPIFGARVIEVEGEERLTPRRVARLAGVEIGTNVFHLDATSTEARLEAEPWILDAIVETRLPGTIRISVRERRPVVVFGSVGARRLVAADGTVLGRAPDGVDLPEVVPVPGVVLDGPTLGTAGEVVQAMAPALRVRVDAVNVAEDGTVTLVVDGDVEVRYGSGTDASAKGQALGAILAYADEEGRGLLSVDVSSPAAPTARFVGSQLPTSIPDPSADVPGEDEASGGAGAAADGDASPSASP